MRGENNYFYRFGEFRFDGETNRLWKNDALILLSPKATELLKCLLQRRGRFVSKQEIFDCVWADTFVEDGVLTQNVYTLRKALGKNADGEPLIENKTRLGYRITVAVEKTDNLNGGDFGGEEISTVASPALAEKTAGDKTSVEETTPQTPPKNWKRLGAICAVLLLLVGAVGFFGSRFFEPQTVVRSRIGLENIRFQKIVDTGDVVLSTLSPDGNLAAYKRGAPGGVYVKDLRTNAETKLEVSNVKKFGALQFSRDGEFLYLRNRASHYLPSDVLKVSRFGGEARTVAENVWSSFSLSPDEQHIAFARSFPTENRQSLIVKNLESGTETEILKLDAPQEFNMRAYPAWSPDGSKLVAVITRQNQGFYKVVVIGADGTAAEDVFFKNFQELDQVVWLPKGNAWAASARDGKTYQLWEISVPDWQIRRLTNDLTNYAAPFVSADGTKLLASQYNIFSNVWAFDAENTDVQKQLTFGTSSRDGYYGMDYCRNGEIIYASNEGETSDTNLWRVNPNDNQRRQLTANAGKRNVHPKVSPDGQYIYFCSNRGGKTSIWRIETSGENPQQITSTEDAADSFPQISPGGEWLYFLRKQAKSAAVWRKSLIDNREEKITDEKTFAPTAFLALSPDGKHLAFQNLTEKIEADNPKQNFQIAVVETERPQEAKFFSIGGREVEIFWTADGAAFDYITPHEDGDRIYRINLNDGAPRLLKAFPREQIFGLARSPDGKTFAAARGQLKYDAVLLTNFE